jgi:preprotein translocase SecF subunit
MRWFEEPSFDFMKIRRIAMIISGILVAIAIIALFTKGLTYGIEFKGGKEYVLKFQKPASVTSIRNDLTKPLNNQPIVKQFGSPEEILIRTDAKGSISDVESTIMAVMGKLFPNNPATVEKTNIVGPRFAKDLKTGALKAVIFALIAIFIYILIRFKDWRMSLGATLGLAHDVLIVAGVYAIFSNVSPFSMQIDETMIGAFLTIVGYTINDTVVVFDRIREFLREGRNMEYTELVNKALNDTLSRTIVTSLTVLFTVIVLFFFGGQVLKGFSFGMIIGVIIGTYSSLFVATGIEVELRLRGGENGKKPPQQKRQNHRRRRVRQHS